VPDDNTAPDSHHPNPFTAPHCRSAGKPRGKRGGRRPGAGAPRGNLNALKHGRRSRQFAEIGAVIAADPGASANLLALARRQQHKHRRAEETAAEVVAAIYLDARQVAQGKPSRDPFAGLARLNDQAKASSVALSKKGRENLNHLLAEINEEMQKHAPTIDHSPNNQPANRKRSLIGGENPSE